MADKPQEKAPQEKAPQEKDNKDQKRGFGRGGPRGKGDGRGRRGEEADWKPVTKLGRLVKAEKITKIEEIFRLAIPIKESEIVDKLLGEKLKEEVVMVKPVQKQTQAGQRTRFKAYIVIGDMDGHIGVGWKASKEVQGAIKGAIQSAKLNIVPVRRGYWGNAIGDPHTVTTKIHGKCGSVRVRLIPAPRGTGLVASATSKKVLQFAGVGDVYTASSGSTKTKGNFAKAVYYALEQTYHFLTPNFWGKPEKVKHPYEMNHAFLHEKKEEQARPQRREGGDRRGGDRGGRRDGGERREGGLRRGGGDRGGERRGGEGRRDRDGGERREGGEGRRDRDGEHRERREHREPREGGESKPATKTE